MSGIFLTALSAGDAHAEISLSREYEEPDGSTLTAAVSVDAQTGSSTAALRAAYTAP